MFQSHSGTIGHFKRGRLERPWGAQGFQSHSGTIGHFKLERAWKPFIWRIVSIPLWDDWALQAKLVILFRAGLRSFNPTLGRLGTSRRMPRVRGGRRLGFNPTLGRLGTSSRRPCSSYERNPSFQSHSGTIGHFKAWRSWFTRPRRGVSIPLWDDWALQVQQPTSRQRHPNPFQSHSGTIGHFKPGGVESSLGCRGRFNPTLGRLGTSRDAPLTGGGAAEPFNPTLGRLGTSSAASTMTPGEGR